VHLVGFTILSCGHSSVVLKHATMGTDLCLVLQDGDVMNLVKNTTFFRLWCMCVFVCLSIQHVINSAFCGVLYKISLERL
jgi:hypothetical protein